MCRCFLDGQIISLKHGYTNIPVMPVRQVRGNNTLHQSPSPWLTKFRSTRRLGRR
jgi:hypothetical protein